MLPELFQIPIRSHQEYGLAAKWEQALFLLAGDVERQIISEAKGQEHFAVEGFCYACNAQVSLGVDYEYGGIRQGFPNWRERLVCPACNLNNRQRAALHLFLKECQPAHDSRIFLAEQVSDLYRFVKKRFSRTTGSEYLKEEIPRGITRSDGVRNESLTSLSFEGGEFDFALCFDVFEHIPDYRRSLQELYRVLAEKGTMIFTVPFHRAAYAHKTRAKIDHSGAIVHAQEPLYHADPLSREGALVFQEFGWQLLDELREVGFKEAAAFLYWSRFYGYLGGIQVVFMCSKCIGVR